MTNITPPPTENLPILQKLSSAYLLWQNFWPHLPRLTRYSLGNKIDILFTDTLELVLLTKYSSKENKLPLLNKAAARFDSLKFFLQVLWQAKGLDNKKYLQLSETLTEIGKMLGGWRRQF